MNLRPALAASIPLLAVLLGVLVLVACERAAPIASSTDATPRQAQLAPAAPVRIVALSPAIAVTLRDIDLGSLLVGRHGFDAWTDQAIPVCGDQSGIDYEALLAVRPTHVLIQWGQRELPPRLTELAARHGWTVRTFNPLSLDDVRAMAVALWDEFAPGRIASEDAAEEEPEWLGRLDAAWGKRGSDLSGAGRVLLLHGVSPPNALGPGSFHHQVLERLRATPAITAGSPYITLDAEDIAAIRPDAIVLLRPRPPGAPSSTARTGVVPRGDLAATLGALATLDIPAVRGGRIAIIDDAECLLPSTSLVRFADDLARVLEAWAAAP